MIKGDPVNESEYTGEEAAAPSFQESDSSDPFAAINNLFAARDSASSSSKLNTTEKLRILIEDGTAYGIHFVVTSLDYQTVRENMYYCQNILTKFPERIIFSLSDNDASGLIEGINVSGLRGNTVYYTDGARDKFQVKPYIAPDPDEIRVVL